MGNLNYDIEQVLTFYNEGAEIGRFERGIGKLEYGRTKEILIRCLPNKSKTIYDIGGGIGVYSSLLANQGHEVHLFELAPKAVEYARKLNKYKSNPINSIEVSDARNIERPDESADVVLLMGPLYHLPQKEDRIKSLQESARVLKKNGLILVSAIPRYSSTLWGLSVFGKHNEFINDTIFFEMIERELTDSQHIRPEKYNKFIARAFFHTPKELKDEIESVGLIHEKTLAIEGPMWMVPSFDEKWEHEESKKRLLKICEKVEEQESLMGMSPHILAVGRK